MCYDTYASDKKLINQIQHNTNNHTLKYCDQNGVKCCIFDIVCDILPCHTKVCLAAIHIQMSVNESIKACSILSLSVPCDSPPLDISSTGCCSQSCWSWDDCLECSYDNYYLCVDQVRGRKDLDFVIIFIFH